MEIMPKKRNFREKYRLFKNKCKILANKIAKIPLKKDKILGIQDSFAKRDLSASPIEKIKIDLRTTRRHQTIHRFA